MATSYLDDVATGDAGRPLLRIAGRPRDGKEESYVILEEPGQPVLMHFRTNLVPHFRKGCPHCTGTDEPKPLYYLGAVTVARLPEMVILELTPRCFETAAAAARHLASPLAAAAQAGPAFTGLLVRIIRSNFARSPRVLRCDERKQKLPAWPYHTREELARIWGVPIRPRLYRADGE